MAEFIVNTDVETDTPTVEVTLSPERPLKLGRHRFRLIVVDDSGNKSVPDEVDVIVADTEAPTATNTASVADCPRTGSSADGTDVVSSAGAASTSLTNTLAPSRANKRAAARPIPLPDPVMIATLSLSISSIAPPDKTVKA